MQVNRGEVKFSIKSKNVRHYTMKTVFWPRPLVSPATLQLPSPPPLAPPQKVASFLLPPPPHRVRTWQALDKTGLRRKKRFRHIVVKIFVELSRPNIPPKSGTVGTPPPPRRPPEGSRSRTPFTPMGTYESWSRMSKTRAERGRRSIWFNPSCNVRSVLSTLALALRTY